MVVKVKDGTRGEQSLCKTCRYAKIVKGTAESQEITRCGVLETLVPFKVVECNSYENKATPSLWDMQQLAWVLSTNKEKKFGFHNPKDWKRQKQEEGDYDDLQIPRGL